VDQQLLAYQEQLCSMVWSGGNVLFYKTVSLETKVEADYKMMDE
jgi:hypothetical protein